MKAVKTKSGKYRVQLSAGYDEQGKRIIKSFTAANEWEAVKMAEDYKKGLVVEDNQLTVNGAFTKYIESRNNILSPASIKTYETIKASRLQLIKDIKINKLKVADVQMAVNYDAKRLTRKSIKSALALLKSALELQDVEINISKITLPPVKPKSKDIPTVEQVMSAVIGSELELPCLLAMWLSLRISEVRGLQFRDISKNGEYITIRRAKIQINNGDIVREVNKTTNSTRTNKLPQYLYNLIKKVPHQNDSDFIIDLGYEVMRRRFKKLMNNHGMNITFHTLRHEFATTLNDLGVPSDYIQKLGGWSTDNIMKSVYTHTTAKQEQTYQNTIDNYFLEMINKIDKSCDNSA